MSPRQPTPEEPENPAKDRPGEIHRDEQREDRGIVYHGDDWDKAEEETERGMVSTDEEIVDPEEEEDVEGHRERDVPDDNLK
jgi:hypothetical protein